VSQTRGGLKPGGLKKQPDTAWNRRFSGPRIAEGVGGNKETELRLGRYPQQNESQAHREIMKIYRRACVPLLWITSPRLLSDLDPDG